MNVKLHIYMYNVQQSRVGMAVLVRTKKRNVIHPSECVETNAMCIYD